MEKFIFGKPFETESVVNYPSDAKVYLNDSAALKYGKITFDKGFCFEYELLDNDKVFGLGQTTSGINKRGKVYESWCSDDPYHTEEKKSLYGAHNFIIVHSEEKNKTFGLYFDYPGKILFDAGYTQVNKLRITADKKDLSLYVIESRGEKKVLSVVEQFRQIIGKSYIPPFWAFGFMQSRWGYGTEEDLKTVYQKYNELGIPLDALFLDIDYMDEFKDFTVQKKNFSDFRKTVTDFKKKNIHIVPIIDAGIKADEGFDIDQEGVKENYFCKKADGSLFAAGVWPGLSHFTDFLNPSARKWFGSKYKVLTDAGIDGFWNDMNEPALFYSEDGIKNAYKNVREMISNENPNVYSTWDVKNQINSLQNNENDYKSFYHQVPENLAGNYGQKIDGMSGFVNVNHYDVHNLYGYNMTRSASDYFTQNIKDPVLLISRASYIGMHRYSGIWTGDNFSWWSHILLLIKQLPSLNMCGFLYTGCDLGGFGCNTNRELLLRFMALGVFTPLMRNHSALGTREQECYRFEKPEDFKGIIDFRYRMIPYLYKLFTECAEKGTMYFKPLSFDYPQDKIACDIEDELMLGDDILLAPVYTPNSRGRTVYLPQKMICISCGKGSGLDFGKPEFTVMEKGLHYVEMPSDKIVFFKKENAKISVVKPALTTKDLNLDSVEEW